MTVLRRERKTRKITSQASSTRRACRQKGGGIVEMHRGKMAVCPEKARGKAIGGQGG